MSIPEKEMRSLRKLKAAIESFNQVKEKVKKSIDDLRELHKAVEPFLAEISLAPKGEDRHLYIKSDHTFPIGNPPLIIKAGASKDELKTALDLIQAELIRKENEGQLLMTELEGRFTHVQNLSKKGGIAE